MAELPTCRKATDKAATQEHLQQGTWKAAGLCPLPLLLSVSASSFLTADWLLNTARNIATKSWDLAAFS